MPRWWRQISEDFYTHEIAVSISKSHINMANLKDKIIPVYTTKA